MPISEQMRDKVLFNSKKKFPCVQRRTTETISRSQSVKCNFWKGEPPVKKDVRQRYKDRVIFVKL